MVRAWLITGCATGFGALLAQKVLDAGDRVVATDRALAAIDHLQAASPDQILKLELDVTRIEQVRSAIGEAFSRMGRIDVVVNNAGLGLGGPFEENDWNRVRLLFEVNCLGVLAVTHACLPHLRKQGGGHLITLSSDSGQLGMPFQAAYCGTKHAVEGFSEALSHEVLPFGIHVTLVEPCGMYRTAMPGPAIEDAARTFHADSPYRPMTEMALERARATLAEAQDPMLVVDAIWNAAEQGTAAPLRVLVGEPSRAELIRARRTMPDEDFIKLIRKHF